MTNLEKTYSVYENESMVVIELEDLRDNYIYKNALGRIGQLVISNYGVIINANIDPHELSLGAKRSKKLLEAFTEIFGTKEYNPLSGEYYHKILNIISKGEMETLGYIRMIDQENLENDILNKTPKH